MRQATRRQLSMLLTVLGATLALADLAVYATLGEVAWWPRHLGILATILVFAGIVAHPTIFRARS